MTELEWAKKIVMAPHCPTVLELGAHHGHDTVIIHDACRPRCTYIAVEADPRNVPILLNRIGNRRVSCAHYAIAADCGTMMLHLSDGPGATGSSSIREPKEHLKHFPGTTFDKAVEVPCITLDALTAKYNVGPVDLIWCDIQGAERDMIAGGQETLRRTMYLLCECDRYEMYAGQATRDKIMELLPDWWLVQEWPENANMLLRNTRI